MMKKISTAILLGSLLIILAGCSTTPEGTVALKDLQRNIEQQIGQKVVVVGNADVRIPGMASHGLFRLYKGYDAVLVTVPEGEKDPPQGARVRVTGVIAEEEFSGGIGRKVYINAQSVRME